MQINFNNPPILLIIILSENQSFRQHILRKDNRNSLTLHIMSIGITATKRIVRVKLLVQLMLQSEVGRVSVLEFYVDSVMFLGLKLHRLPMEDLYAVQL